MQLKAEFNLSAHCPSVTAKTKAETLHYYPILAAVHLLAGRFVVWRSESYFNVEAASSENTLQMLLIKPSSKCYLFLYSFLGPPLV